MNDISCKIQVTNYFDKQVKIENQKIKKIDIEKIKNSFPEIDEFSLVSWEKEWRNARQIMIDIKF